SCARLYFSHFLSNDPAPSDLYTLSLHDALPIFATDLLPLIVEHDAMHLSGPRDAPELEPPYEEIVPPRGERVARIERHAGDRDRRIPEEHRILDADHRPQLRDGRAAVIASVAHERPAVVRARLQDIHLVPAERTVLVLPDLAGRRMDGHADHIAVTDGVDLGLEARNV